MLSLKLCNLKVSTKYQLWTSFSSVVLLSKVKKQKVLWEYSQVAIEFIEGLKSDAVRNVFQNLIRKL